FMYVRRRHALFSWSCVLFLRSRQAYEARTWLASRRVLLGPCPDEVLARESYSDHLVHIVHYAHYPDDGRRRDRRAVVLVVEADVAAGDGRAQGFAGTAHALHRLLQRPEHLRLFGAAEVEAVGDPHRPAAAADDVAGRFRHRDHAAGQRVQLAVAGVAVHLEGDGPPGAGD